MFIAELFIITQSINDPNVYTSNAFDGQLFSHKRMKS